MFLCLKYEELLPRDHAQIYHLRTSKLKGVDLINQQDSLMLGSFFQIL